MASKVDQEEIKSDDLVDVQEKDKKEYDLNWLKGTSAETIIKKTNLDKLKKNDFSNPVFKKLSKINGEINDMSIDDLVASLNEIKLDSSGKKEVLIKRLKTYYKETKLKTIGPVAEEQFNCRFDYVCVIDYEATCTETQIKAYPHEIIEFPIVLIDMKTLTIVDYFSSYCRPILNPKLSKFCTELTGITQEQVDKADEFPIVLNRVKEWLESHELGTKYKFAVATDGPWDMQNFLNLQCSHSKILYPRWAKKWIDIRKLFSNWLGVRRCGISRMLGYCGFEFEGQQHCGLDDAKNIARILIRIAKDGCEIKQNDHIKKCLCDFEKKTPTITNSTDLPREPDSSSDDDSLEFPEE